MTFTFATPTGTQVEVFANDCGGFGLRARGATFVFGKIVTSNAAIGPHIAIGENGPKIQISADDLSALRGWMAARKAEQDAANAKANDDAVKAYYVENRMADMGRRNSVN
jgi:hypothetical protein